MALAVWRPQDDAAPHGAGRQLVGVFSSPGQCGDRAFARPTGTGWRRAPCPPSADARHLVLEKQAI